MKRLVLWVVLVIIAATIVGTLMSRDAGYVLVTWNGAMLQTSFWMLLLLLILGFGVIYGGVRFYKFVRYGPANFRNWRGGRRQQRAFNLTVRGLNYLEAGDAARAERFLLSGAELAESPSLNYLAAAKAADVRHRHEDRERFLRLAAETPGAETAAIALVEAEMAAARHDWRACLHALEASADSEAALLLRRRALTALEDWSALDDLLPRLRKVLPFEEIQQIQSEALLARLAVPDLTLESADALVAAVDRDVAGSESVVEARARALHRLKAWKPLEKLVRETLGKRWQPLLLDWYADIGRELLPQRLKAAEGWLAAHRDDADLLACIGRLYAADGRREDAIEYLNRSLALRPSRVASRELAELHAFAGDHVKSVEHFRQALRTP